MVHKYRASGPGAPVESSKFDLDPSHSHFIIVDGDEAQAADVRERVEYYISSQDLSDDGIQTPKLLIVVSGDASTLEWVRNGLDASDPATLTSVPVVVVAESGGAAVHATFPRTRDLPIWASNQPPRPPALQMLVA